MAFGTPVLSTPAEAASGNLTLAEPTGTVQGDLLVACIAIRSTVGFANTDWGSPLESQLTGDTDATNGIASGQMFAVVRGANAPSYVFTRTGGDVARGVVLRYPANGGTVTIRAVHASQTLAAANATANAPTVSTVDPHDLIVAMAALGDNGTVNTFDAATDPTTISSGTDTTNPPSDGQWRMRISTGTGTGADTTLGVGDALRATAGATGTIQMASSINARHAGIVAVFAVAAAPQVNVSATLAGSGALTGTPKRNRATAATMAGAGALAATLTVVAASALTLELREGANVRATRTWTPPEANTRQTITLSAGEKASVTDWTAAEWWISAAGGVRAVRITYAHGLAPSALVPTDVTATMAGSGALVVTLTAIQSSEVTLELREGGTLRATRSWTPPEGLTRQTITLTTQEKDAVGNWANAEWWISAAGGRAVRLTYAHGTAPTGTPTTDVTATSAGTGALVATLSRIRQLAPTTTGSGALVAGLTRVRSRTATFAGTGALAATLTKAALTRDVTGTLAGAGTLAASLTARSSLVATAAGTGVLSASLTRRRALTATPAGAGTLIAVATHRRSLTAAFAGSGAVSPSLTRLRALSGALAGSGALSATPSRVRPLTATLAGAGGLASILTIAEEGTTDIIVTLAGHGALVPSLTRLRSRSASMAGTGALAAALARQRAVSATTAGSGALAAGLTADRPLVANLAGAGALVADLTRAAEITDLVATLAGTGALLAALDALVPVEVGLGGVGALVATLTADRALAPTFAGVGALTGGLEWRAPTQTWEVAATFDGYGALGSLLTVAYARPILAPFAGEGTLTAALSARRSLTATLAGRGALLAAPPTTFVRLVNVWLRASLLLRVQMIDDTPHPAEVALDRLLLLHP